MDETVNIDWPDTPFPLESHLILAGKRGSEAHGTYIPPTDPNGIDDRDVMGIAIPPRKYYLGLSRWTDAESIKGVWDVVLYDIQKYVSLLVKQNPNVLSLLWLLPEDYYFRSPLGDRLIENRSLFASRACYKSFCGYANGQLSRMIHVSHRGYLGAKRKALVEKHGYDTKNAAHLVRLLHMGKEFLATGEMNVRRTWDVEMILEIKQGKWGIQRVYDYAAKLFDAVREAEKTSPLPPRLNMRAIDELVVRIMEERLFNAPPR
jgi:uncharacterized protein